MEATRCRLCTVRGHTAASCPLFAYEQTVLFPFCAQLCCWLLCLSSVWSPESHDFLVPYYWHMSSLNLDLNAGSPNRRLAWPCNFPSPPAPVFPPLHKLVMMVTSKGCWRWSDVSKGLTEVPSVGSPLRKLVVRVIITLLTQHILSTHGVCCAVVILWPQMPSCRLSDWK